MMQAMPVITLCRFAVLGGDFTVWSAQPQSEIVLPQVLSSVLGTTETTVHDWWLICWM